MERIYSVKRLSGTTRDRPGLQEELAACWAGGTLVATKLDRLARSARDARDIADELAGQRARRSFNGSTHDPADPMGRMVFGMLGVFAEFTGQDSEPLPPRPLPPRPSNRRTR